MQISFRTKALLAIAVISLFSSLLIGTVLLRRTEQIVENNYIRSIWNTESVSIGAFEDSARQAYNLAVKLSLDPGLSDLIRTHGEKPYDLQSALAVSSYLGGFYNEDSPVEVIYLYLPDTKQVITSVDYNATREVFYPEQNTWATRWEDHYSTDLAPGVVVDRISRAPKNALTYTRPIYADDLPQQIQAIVSVLLDERRLFYQCLSMGVNSSDSYYLVDPDGLIASSAIVGEIGLTVSEISESAIQLLSRRGKESVLRTRDYLLVSLRSPMTGYSIVSKTDRAGLTALLRNQQKFILILLLAVLVIMLIPAYWLSQRINRPIQLLQRAMEKVAQGDLSARAEVVTKDEIGQLSEGFNDMIDRIETLIEEVVDERTQKKQAELEALQYQITPHFMYNTLNSIKYAALLQGADSIGEQLGAFIELLQASISRKGAFLTVLEEIRMVRNYVKLQEFRYMEKYDITIKIDGDVGKFYVPRLILQPLVENAIMHGESDTHARSQITVSADRDGGDILLTVQDNGKGMSSEQVERIMHGRYKIKGYFSGIGVSNIVERLRLHYGERADICFESAPKRGVKVTIRLPATENPEEYTL